MKKSLELHSVSAFQVLELQAWETPDDIVLIIYIYL